MRLTLGETAKARLTAAVQIVWVVLLVPQFFVYLYHVRYLFLGDNWPEMMRALSVYALTMSWVSGPYLAGLALGFKALVRRRARWWVLFLALFAAGYAWVALWNLIVYDRAFSYLWSLPPLLVCSFLFSGYAAARMLYLRHLESSVPGDLKARRS